MVCGNRAAYYSSEVDLVSTDNTPAVYYIDAGPGEANYYNPVTDAIAVLNRC